MSIQPNSSDGRAITIPMMGPVESFFRHAGQRLRIRTWTRAQWERLPAPDRPPIAWPHGDLMMGADAVSGSD